MLPHVTRAGRRKLHVLASPGAVTAIEALAAVSPSLPVESLREARTGSRLQRARVCYGHLGGGLAVALTDQLVVAGVVRPSGPAAPTTVPSPSPIPDTAGPPSSRFRVGALR
ncbi:hypothetical protein [Streptomyces sp. NPDC007205]|uniref:hypothetical protein n=1 Tax=Streptomyces sp. NPDC007205 TaxID=3154316 RepID=UPI00340BC314